MIIMILTCHDLPVCQTLTWMIPVSYVIVLLVLRDILLSPYHAGYQFVLTIAQLSINVTSRGAHFTRPQLSSIIL